MKKTLIVALSLLFCLDARGFDIYLLRHFEKLPEKNNPGLTDVGQARAEKLASLMATTTLSLVYSTDYRRTVATALPTADSKGIDITLYDPRQLKSFAQKVLQQKQNVMIVGHSNTTPELIRLLGGEAEAMSESDYGQVFVLSVKETLSQRELNVEL